MRRQASRLVALAVLVLAAPARAGDPEVKKSATGLGYAIRVPDGWQRERGGLMVVAFHGRGDTPARFMKCVEAIAGLESAVLVVPQAPKNGAWEDSRDTKIAGELVAELAREHQPARTVTLGFSLGAYFSYLMAITHPELVQAAVAHSGGIDPFPVPQPAGAALKRQAFFVIHGAADSVVPVALGRKAVRDLRKADVSLVRYVEVPALDHAIDWTVLPRAFAWIEAVLGPPVRPLSDEEGRDRVAALERALAEKRATPGDVAALAGAPRSLGARIAALLKGPAAGTDELALAAIEAAGRLGEAGLPVLEGVSPANEPVAIALARAIVRAGPGAQKRLLELLRWKSEKTAAAAAAALGELGTEPAIETLLSGLRSAEASPDGRLDAIRAAVLAATGRRLHTAKELAGWLAESRSAR